MSSNDQSSASATQHDELNQTLTFRDVVQFFRRYSTFLWFVTIVAVLLSVIGVLFAHFSSPARTVTTLPFQLEFNGAERGEYPNGTAFSTAEILSAPILLNVYKECGLEEYVSFDVFRGSVFVIAESGALERLEREYQPRLADPRLSPVDRERLEDEFAEKKAALSRSGYSINLITTSSVQSIPRSVRSLALSSILSNWAEVAVKNKGISLWDISILSSTMFEQEALGATDYLVAADILLTKINRVLKNIEELQKIPGAKLVRTGGNDHLSLADLHLRLTETKQFTLQPLIAHVAANGLSTDPRASLEYLTTRLTFIELAKKQAEWKVDLVRDALSTYVQYQGTSYDGSGAGSPPSLTGGQTIIPQIDDGFLDRIFSLSTGAADMQFRQSYVDLLTETLEAVTPLRAEVEYYQTITSSMKSRIQSARPAAAAESAEFERAMQDVRTEAIRATDQVNEIYTQLSANLNPSTTLYSTGAEKTRTERAVSISRLTVLASVILLLFLPIVILGTLLYDRFSAAARE